MPQIKAVFNMKEEICNPINLLSQWNMLPEKPQGEADEDTF